MKKQKLIGGLCGIMTGFCWASAGVFSQYLFTTTTMTSGWFVAIRMIVSGICLLGFVIARNGRELRTLIHNPAELLLCIVSGILGTMMFQMACYRTVQLSNAATAIVLQYLCPVMVMLYVCIRDRKLPEKKGILSVLLAVGGIFLISTHGNLHSLVITQKALVWGIGCAFFMMLCTILPEVLYRKYSVWTIMAVSLLSGGIAACILQKPHQNIPAMNINGIFALIVAVLIGCLLSYVFYGQAVKLIGSSEASLYACFEILAATIMSVLFLESTFMYLDILGFAMITATIFILSI